MKGLIGTSDEHRYIPVSSRVVPNIHGLWSIFQGLEGNIAALYLKVSTKTAGWEQSSENHQTFHKFVASSASSVEATNIFDQAAYAGLHNHIVATSHHAGMICSNLACLHSAKLGKYKFNTKTADVLWGCQTNLRLLESFGHNKASCFSFSAVHNRRWRITDLYLQQAQSAAAGFQCRPASEGSLGFVGRARKRLPCFPTFAELNEPWFSREVQVVLGSNCFKR